MEVIYKFSTVNFVLFDTHLADFYRAV